MLPEREKSQEAALKISKEWLIKNNFSMELEVSETELVARSFIKGSDGSILSSAAGKGYWCKVGAYFEAIEHFMLEENFFESNTKILFLKDWIERYSHPDCIFSNAMKEYKDCHLKFHEYKSFNDGKPYYIPEILVNPFTIDNFQSPPSLFLQKYSSNSGWASGCTFKEAFLHGVNEVIERDYVSELYKSLIEFSDNVTFFKISEELDFFKKYKTKHISQKNINVIFCPTKYDSFFCFCYIMSKEKPISLRASAVSYSAEHAIERALFELEQTAELYDINEEYQDRETKFILEKYEKLKKILYLSETKKYPEFSIEYNQDHDLEKQFTVMINSFKKSKTDILYNEAYNKDGIFLISTFIPGMERFNIIDSGKIIAPLGK